MPILACNQDSGRKAFSGEAWLACNPNRPKSASETTPLTVKRMAVETSSRGEMGASCESSDGFCARRMIVSPALTRNCAASAELRTTESGGNGGTAGFCASAQNFPLTPRIWT